MTADLGYDIIHHEKRIAYMQSKGKDVVMIAPRIPAKLYRSLSILLLDPATGKIKYGALRKLVTSLLSNWVEEKRKVHVDRSSH